jgi:hypothetical protein
MRVPHFSQKSPVVWVLPQFAQVFTTSATAPPLFGSDHAYTVRCPADTVNASLALLPHWEG